MCEELLTAGANTEVADVEGLTRMIKHSNYLPHRFFGVIYRGKLKSAPPCGGRSEFF